MTDRGLFHFPTARRADAAVDAWLATRPGVLGEMARFWFGELRRCGADVRELLHDGCPVACVEDAAFAYVNVFTAHVNLGFYRGAYLDDPHALLHGSGRRMRHVKLRPGSGLDPLALGHLLEEAYLDMKRQLGDLATAQPRA